MARKKDVFAHLGMITSDITFASPSPSMWSKGALGHSSRMTVKPPACVNTNTKRPAFVSSSPLTELSSRACLDKSSTFIHKETLENKPKRDPLII
jgi:hypothetical protein